MAELKQILHKITALCDVPEPYVLKQLIDELRVPSSRGMTPAEKVTAHNHKIQSLIDVLQQHPEYATGLAVFVLTLINKHHRMSLFTDTGILSDQSFSHSLMQLVSHRFLPLLPEDSSIVELVDYLFDGKHDEEWLASIDEKLWDELIDLIMVDDAHTSLVATAKSNILSAMVVLSYRISGIGLHPDLMKFYPQMLDYSAAFVAQNKEAVLFANEYREAHQLDSQLDIIPDKEVDTAPLLVMLDQCEDIVSTIRKRIYKTGISIRLTNMLLRLEQSLKRMQILSELLSNEHKNRDKAVIELTQAIIVSAKTRYSIRHLIDNNTKLLSQKMTENSSRVGEHYISTDKSGYKKMFKKAAIGGFVIAFMATLKILSYDLQLAPMGRAFVYSMIYGLGFVFIHIIHGTVATKQPAMTAAAIASTISDSSGKKTHKLNKLSELMVDILRTQFIAIMGNILIAMPLALIISLIWLQVSGEPMIGLDKAEHLLHDLDPFASLALFHAAIAGVFLFLAGLIAGYYDNLAIFNHIGERISRHKLLLKVFPKRTLERLGSFVEGNLGAIMGNFLFGVFLGSTGTLGYIFGLPLDIRHIAFSSANFAHGLFNMPADSLTLSVVLISLLGVALIGMINLLVSFSLAMLVALRTKGVRFFEWKDLSKLIFNHLLTHPKDFFWPRPEPMQYANIDSDGHIIYQEAHLTQHNRTLLDMPTARKLDDVKVLPDGVKVDTKKIEAIQQKRDFESQLTVSTDAKANSSQSSDTNKPSAKNNVVVLDGSLQNHPERELIEAREQQKNKQSEAQQTLINDDETNLTSLSHKPADSDLANAKTPLPKPKNPPKLPE